MRLFALVLIIPFTRAANGQQHVYTHTWTDCDCTYARFTTILVHTDSNGRFIYTYPDKKIDSIGRYLHGKKEGLWMAWHYNGMIADSTVYSNGNPIGISLSFYPIGTLAAVELVDHDSLLEHQYFDENGQPTDTARKDRIASFKGGSQAWVKWPPFPQMAARNQPQPQDSGSF